MALHSRQCFRIRVSGTRHSSPTLHTTQPPPAHHSCRRCGAIRFSGGPVVVSASQRVSRRRPGGGWHVAWQTRARAAALSFIISIPPVRRSPFVAVVVVVRRRHQSVCCVRRPIIRAHARYILEYVAYYGGGCGYCSYKKNLLCKCLILWAKHDRISNVASSPTHNRLSPGPGGGFGGGGFSTGASQ